MTDVYKVKSLLTVGFLKRVNTVNISFYVSEHYYHELFFFHYTISTSILLSSFAPENSVSRSRSSAVLSPSSFSTYPVVSEQL